MSTLFEQVAKPQGNFSSKRRKASPSSYNQCPSCDGMKLKKASRCWGCRFTRPQVVQPADENIKLIALTKGKIVKLDAIDYDRLSKRLWLAQLEKKSGNYYATRLDYIDGKPVLVAMHRDILDVPKGKICDHINRDTLDNRRCNLRIVDAKQSAQNRGKNKNNTSGYIGVHFHKRDGIWAAEIMVDGKNRWLGSFHDPKDAARAYDKNAFEVRGIYAVLNFPEEYGDKVAEFLA